MSAPHFVVLATMAIKDILTENGALWSDFMDPAKTPIKDASEIFFFGTSGLY